MKNKAAGIKTKFSWKDYRFLTHTDTKPIRKEDEAVNKKRLLVLICMLALLATIPAPGRMEPANGWAEVTVNSPPLVALTFDDGPRSITTGPLLDGLALRETPATFFLVGNRIPGNEDLIRRMAVEGHQIGIHTYDHVELKGLSQEDFDLQVGKTRALITELLGEGNYWLRPPYGILDEAARSWCGGPLILWSVDPEDWKDEDVDRVVAAVVEHVSDGDIILLHDLFPSSVEAALRVVDTLLSKGYCFVTVEQLLAQRGIPVEAGTCYRRAIPAKN